jgi:hypothetical protein
MRYPCGIDRTVSRAGTSFSVLCSRALDVIIVVCMPGSRLFLLCACLDAVRASMHGQDNVALNG